MPGSYTSWQPSNPRRHPTCWASLQWSRTVSGTPCHGPGHLLHLALTRPSSANARRRKSRHPFVPAAQHLISLSDNNNNICAAQWADHQRNAEWTDNPTWLRIFITDTSIPPSPQEWPYQDEPGSDLTAFAPVSDVSAPAFTNGVWPPLRPVSETQNNKPSTMSSSNVQSIDLPMDCMAWRLWTMRQPNDCSTSSLRSSVAKQWFEELAQKKKKSGLQRRRENLHLTFVTPEKPFKSLWNMHSAELCCVTFLMDWHLSLSAVLPLLAQIHILTGKGGPCVEVLKLLLSISKQTRDDVGLTFYYASCFDLILDGSYCLEQALDCIEFMKSTDSTEIGKSKLNAYGIMSTSTMRTY